MTASYTSARILSRSFDRSRSKIFVAAVSTALLGIVIIWGVGFSPIEVLHNAAHDVRHSSGFPCH